MEELITQQVLRAIEDRLFPGCVIGVIKKGDKYVLPFGKLTYEQSSEPVTKNTIYDLASLTKVIPTSIIALQLIDQGVLRLNDKVAKYLPELNFKYSDEISIWHLLTHTVAFDLKLSELKEQAPEEIMDAIFTRPLKTRPGGTYFYTNTTSILLAVVLERATRKTLDTLAQDLLFDPLGMSDTSFHNLSSDIKRIAPSEIDKWRGEVRGVVHDESAYTLGKDKVVGSAGLFSTVPDVLTFLEMILKEGEYNGRRYLSQEIIDTMALNQLQGERYTGLGWELNQAWFMGKYTSEHAIGKTGFTGCSIVCDKDRKIGLVILSNSTYPHRPQTKDAINRLRRDVANLVFF